MYSFLFFHFSLEIITDLLESCKSNTKNSCIPLHSDSPVVNFLPHLLSLSFYGQIWIIFHDFFFLPKYFSMCFLKMRTFSYVITVQVEESAREHWYNTITYSAALCTTAVLYHNNNKKFSVQNTIQDQHESGSTLHVLVMSL